VYEDLTADGSVAIAPHSDRVCAPREIVTSKTRQRGAAGLRYEMRLKRLIASLVAGYTLTGLAHAAEPPAYQTANQLIRSYYKNDFNREMASFGLGEMASGMTTMNVELSANNRLPLYCLPSKLSLTDEQEFNILEDYVKHNPRIGDGPVGLALLFALENVFPCK
jgi:hypothetical protein